MTGPSVPRLNKAPFLAGDLLLLAAAAWLVLRTGPPLEPWRSALVVGCVALGAWLALLPFLTEYQASVRLAEGEGLASTVDQIKELKAAAAQVAGATARWQAVQESAGQTAQTAKEIADRIADEARRFSEMMQKVHAAEVRNLTLQVEKLQLAEGDWLKMVVLLLDHVFALHSAGVESGQPSLIEHLTRFQNACRDVVRRVGLVPVEAAPGTPFDERLHQVPEGMKVEPGAVIARTVATGYTYQGQLLRRMLVVVGPPPSAGARSPALKPSSPLVRASRDRRAGGRATSSESGPVDTRGRGGRLQFEWGRDFVAPPALHLAGPPIDQRQQSLVQGHRRRQADLARERDEIGRVGQINIHALQFLRG